MSDQAARLAETVKEALHFALSRTTDDPVQYRRIAAALAAVDELARVSREAEQLRADERAQGEEVERLSGELERLLEVLREMESLLPGAVGDLARAALAAAGDRP